MLNDIGLQNTGVTYFMENDLPYLKKFDTAIIVNACGSTIDEYVELAKVLNTLDIDGVELNLSCPNVKAGCLAFGTTYEGVKEVTSQVRKVLIPSGRRRRLRLHLPQTGYSAPGAWCGYVPRFPPRPRVSRCIFPYFPGPIWTGGRSHLPPRPEPAGNAGPGRYSL